MVIKQIISRSAGQVWEESAQEDCKNVKMECDEIKNCVMFTENLASPHTVATVAGSVEDNRVVKKLSAGRVLEDGQSVDGQVAY